MRISELKTVNVVAAKIKKQDKTIIVMSIYIPCDAKKSELAEDLRYIGDTCDEFDKYIIGGDWNARTTRWNVKDDYATNTNGAVVLKWLEESEERILRSTKEITFRNVSKLDHFVISINLDMETSIEMIIAGRCHDAIKIKWKEGKREIERYVHEERKSYKNLDWANFREKITINLVQNIKLPKHRNITYEEIDKVIAEISEIITETENECTKKVIIRKAGMVELTEEVKALMRKRRNAKKEKRKVNSSEEWKEIKKEVIKETNKDIRTKISKQQAEELETKIKAISTKGEPFKEIRRLSEVQRRSFSESKLMVRDEDVEGEKEKAKMLARWYEGIAKEKLL